MISKQNALTDYIEILNNKNKLVIGGILIKDKGSWWWIENNREISN